MIYLVRTSGADIVITKDGIEHPDIIYQLVNIFADFNEPLITFKFLFYHDIDCYQEGYLSIHTKLFPNFDKSNDLTYTFTDYTSPTFITVMNLFDFSTSVNFKNPQGVGNWLLRQNDPINKGNSFSVNWDYIG